MADQTAYRIRLMILLHMKLSMKVKYFWPLQIIKIKKVFITYRSNVWFLKKYTTF